MGARALTIAFGRSKSLLEKPKNEKLESIGFVGFAFKQKKKRETKSGANSITHTQDPYATVTSMWSECDRACSIQVGDESHICIRCFYIQHHPHLHDIQLQLVAGFLRPQNAVYRICLCRFLPFLNTKCTRHTHPLRCAHRASISSHQILNNNNNNKYNSPFVSIVTVRMCAADSMFRLAIRHRTNSIQFCVFIFTVWLLVGRRFMHFGALDVVLLLTLTLFVVIVVVPTDGWLVLFVSFSFWIACRASFASSSPPSRYISVLSPVLLWNV